MAERWHSVDEVSEHLGVAQDTIYRWISAGRIPAHRIGRLWKFQLHEVDQWVRDGRTNDEPEPVSAARGTAGQPAQRRRKSAR